MPFFVEKRPPSGPPSLPPPSLPPPSQPPSGPPSLPPSLPPPRLPPPSQPPNEPLPTTEANYKNFFKNHDTDHDDALSRKELEKAFGDLGSRCPWWRAKRCLHQADRDRDGYINKEELTHVAKYAAEHKYTFN